MLFLPMRLGYSLVMQNVGLNSGSIKRGGIGVTLALILMSVGATSASAQLRVPSSQREILLSFAPLVREAGPAVVNVLASRVQTRRVFRSPIFDDPFFRQFFGDTEQQEQTRESQSVGSGVVVESDGLIVTNHHVIEGADEITVVLSDRRQFAAKIVRDDERTDLAILQIDIGEERLPYLELSDSEILEVGELVLAIGNPFGVGQTVTSGIVSALARTNRGISDLNFFIQTDAAINPGNSGGALIRMDGTLAGINTAIFSQTGGSQGVGFAIPANMVRTVINSVGAVGGLQRPWLGAEGQTVTADVASQLGLDRPAGVLITSIYPNGPADRSGLRPGDVILAIDNRPVDDGVSLNFRLATTELGGFSALSIVRTGQTLDLTFPVEPPSEEPAPDTTLLSGRTPFSGSTVANLSPALAQAIGSDTFAQGVVITQVDAGSIAARLNMQVLDIIREINGADIDNVQVLNRALDEDPDAWIIAIERDGEVTRFTVTN